MAADHPRYKYFPWQTDYSAQPNVFCPYVMAVAQPGYHSESLNIDSLGFRYQYDLAGQLIDLPSAKSRYKECTLILGNSTAFGVSLSSDIKSLGHYLGSEDAPCINLSVRGATMQQELALFLTYKNLLPSVKKIFVLTGVCDISLATQSADLWSPHVGGMHSIDAYSDQCYKYVRSAFSTSAHTKKIFMDWAEAKYTKSRILRGLFQKYVERKNADIGLSPEINFRHNIGCIFSIMENVFESWGWLKRATGVDVQIILQPVLGWTKKPLSSIESECLAVDLNRIPAISMYANHRVYLEVLKLFKIASQRSGLAFIDANAYFDSFGCEQTLFSDICHLTDIGTEKLADLLQTKYSENPISS